MEKLHHTGMMMVGILAVITGSVFLVPLASHLPFTFQRSLAFLPLNISPDARMAAEDSNEWRLAMWKALYPLVPQYLLIGKGYAFSPEVYNQSMGASAQFHNNDNFDASQDPLALSSDFHSGPLSVVLTFGIWGVIVWLWYWAAGFWVLLRNYRYGDPELRHINLFLVALFVARCFSFLFIFGSMVEAVGQFGALFGLSIAFNHGIKRRRPQASPNQRPASPRLALSPRPAFQR
jgi:hypothetical protein